MIRINLLPFRSTRQKENIRRQLSVFLLSIILTLVGLTGVKTRWRTTWGASHLTTAKI